MSTSSLLCFSCSITLYTNSFMLSTSIYVVRSNWRYLKFRLILCCIFVCNLISTCFLNLIVFWVLRFILSKHDLKRGLSFANVLRFLCYSGSWKIIVVHDWKITVLFHNFYTFLLSAEWLFNFCWLEIMTVGWTYHTLRCFPYWHPYNYCNGCCVLVRGLFLILTGKDHHFNWDW